MTVEKKVVKNLIINLVFVLLSLIMVSVFVLSKKIYGGGDLVFHINRIDELANALKNNNNIIDLFSFATFNNIGNAVQQCYPNFTLIPFAIFKLLFSSPIIAYYAGIVFYSYITFAIAYYSCLKMDSGARQAFIFAVLYAFSHYRLINIFRRFAMGEWIAMSFIPLALVGAYLILFRSQSRWYLLSIGLTLIIYSHVLSLLLVVGLIIIMAVCALLFRSDHIVKRFALLIGASFLSLILGSVEMYQIFMYVHGGNLYLPAGQATLSSSALPVKSLLANAFSNEIASYTGLEAIITFILVLLFWRKLSYVSKSASFLSVLFLILSTTIIPWNLLATTPLETIQFPWRFLTLFSVLLAFAGAEVLENLLNMITHHYLEKLTFIGVIASTVALGVYPLYRWQESARQNTQAATAVNYDSVWPGSHIFNKSSYKMMSHNSTSFIYVDYWPTASVKNRDSINKKEVLLNGHQSGTISFLSYKDNIASFSFKANKGDAVYDLPVLFYGKRYKITVNGKATAYSKSQRSTIQVVLRKGLNKIEVKRLTSKKLLAFEIISLLSWIILIVYVFKDRAKRKNEN
ncbi:hypothetical protein FC19_GL000435 [Liquorilactobacillus aquaticus DSM 21051]|uniref:Membrane protein 6-pyruvoyl-tetrahydropterin synthase-related domain-containing protein n=1 Tax=Liquorilactobacillus aquaticus DSM 21051 TaxID=1423725 RepID=A0A0R2D989_9LACO|nr:hypothetical protein [Liquorilactobacillus aquaticus]KRM96908.1 hypothetical protein FC19_GL000435 [Liquorilactobacillus aquaticus DSM 21051]